MSLTPNTVLYANANKVFASIPQGTSGQVLTTDVSLFPVWGADPNNGIVASLEIASNLFTVTGGPIITSGTINLTKSSIGTGGIVLNTNPTISNLQLSNMEPQSLVYADTDKKLIPIETGPSGQALVAGPLGTTTWASTPTVNSVTVSSSTSILTISNPTVTTSGVININQALSPQGTGAIVLAVKPFITNLKVTSLTTKTMLYINASSKLASLPNGTTGQVILNSGGGNFAWNTYPQLGITSIGISSNIFTVFTIANSPITSTGTITINPTITPQGTGAIVLDLSPTIQGLTISDLTASTIVFNNSFDEIDSVTPGVSTNVLRGNCTWGAASLLIQSIDLAVPSIFTKTGGPITTTGTITIGTTTTPQGTGAVVLQTTPTITTPVLTNPRLNDSNLYLRSSGTTTSIVYGTTLDGPDISGLGGGRLLTNGSSRLEWGSSRVRLPTESANGFLFADASKDFTSRTGMSYQNWTQSSDFTLFSPGVFALATNMNATQSGGQGQLTQYDAPKALFENQTGFDMLYFIAFSGGCNSTGLLDPDRELTMRIQKNNSTVGSTEVSAVGGGGFLELNVSATGIMVPSDIIKCEMRQVGNGSSVNVQRAKITITTFPLWPFS